ncbi:MAG: aminotransferase class IV [Pseudomonadota bacterium]
MPRLFSLNFQIVPPEKAVVPVMDRSFLYGDSVYETVRSYRIPDVFLLDRHYKRLLRSAEAIAFRIPFSLERLVTHLGECLKKAGNPESYIRIVVSRGTDFRFNLFPDPGIEPTTAILVDAVPKMPAEYYEKGAEVALVSVIRNHPRSVDPNIKTGNYMNNMLALIEAYRRNAVEAIMLNQEGFVTEATTSNVFAVKDGKVLTPEVRSGLLEGVSRSLLVEIVQREKIPFAEKAISEAEFLSCDEIFLTGSIKELLPIARINGRPVGNGGVGPMTKRMMQLWRAEVERINRGS